MAGWHGQSAVLGCSSPANSMGFCLQAAVRKAFIKDKLDEMKSTQNFKGLKKLTAMAGLSEPAAADEEGAPAEPMSPAP